MISDEAVEAACKAFRETALYDDALMNALEAAAPHILKDMRPMTSVELASRDRPESMAAARAKVREDRAAYHAEMFRAAREAAWQEGHQAGRQEYCLDANPYKSQA